MKISRKLLLLNKVNPNEDDTIVKEYKSKEY